MSRDTNQQTRSSNEHNNVSFTRFLKIFHQLSIENLFQNIYEENKTKNEVLMTMIYWKIAFFNIQSHIISLLLIQSNIVNMKLEQSINRFSKGQGGYVCVGASGDTWSVAEFELLFHEIMQISNLMDEVIGSILGFT